MNEKTTLADAMPESIEQPPMNYLENDALQRMGVEFGKNKDLGLFLLRLMQKQEDIKTMRKEIDRLEIDGIVNPMMAGILRVRMGLQEGQDLLFAALRPEDQSRLVSASNSMFTMAQWLSPGDEAFNPVVLSVDTALTEHERGFLSRAGRDQYNTMINVFKIFTTNVIEQKLDSNKQDENQKKKKHWLW